MFVGNFLELFNTLPKEVATMLLAMLPIAELRVALPVALLVYKFTLLKAFFWSILGNIIPVIFLIWLLGPVVDFLSKNSKMIEKFFNWWFERVGKRFEKKSLKYGVSLALILFVAIPLPITGAWSGSVAAFLFRIEKKRALGLIFCGVLLASVIVTLLTKAGVIIVK